MLNELRLRRQDIIFTGVDNNSNYHSYAINKYKNVSFELADVFDFKTLINPEIVTVLGGIHHLNYERQEMLLSRISGILDDKSILYIGEELVDENIPRDKAIDELWWAIIEYAKKKRHLISK